MNSCLFLVHCTLGVEFNIENQLFSLCDTKIVLLTLVKVCIFVARKYHYCSNSLTQMLHIS
jgi:hypothetical protein